MNQDGRVYSMEDVDEGLLSSANSTSSPIPTRQPLFYRRLQRLLQSTDRTRQLKDFITPIRLRGSAQISLIVTIRHLSEFARALSRRARLIMLSYSGDVEIVE